MSKKKSNFIVSDVKRTVTAVMATGLQVVGVEIGVDGRIIVRTAANETTVPKSDPQSPYTVWKEHRDRKVGI